MSKTLRVRPRPGLILAGIPTAGADVDAKLAKEWLDNDMVVLIEDKPDETVKTDKEGYITSPAKEDKPPK